MELAPIVLFVYNRPRHTELVLEALMENELADQSTLFIYCDGPKASATEKDLQNIKDVRSIIHKKKWCKELVIIQRDINIGLANSVIEGVSQVIKRQGKIIVLEDDILTGKYFLVFMNQGLNIYRNEKRVFGISGYKYPSVTDIKDSNYFLPIASSWGYATWKDRWEKVNFSSKQLINEIEKGNLKKEVDFGGNSYFNMLNSQLAGNIDSWAIRFYVSMFLNKAYFLYPNSSLVTNIGFDNTGTHCGEDSYYSKILNSQEKIEVYPQKVELKEDIVKKVESSFFNKNLKQVKSITLKDRLKQFLKF